MAKKVVMCGQCGWRGPKAQVLTAIHPFDPCKEYVIDGCPQCYEINTMRDVCNVGKCENAPQFIDSRGRWTCEDHADFGD